MEDFTAVANADKGDNGGVDRIDIYGGEVVDFCDDDADEDVDFDNDDASGDVEFDNNNTGEVPDATGKSLIFSSPILHT